MHQSITTRLNRTSTRVAALFAFMTFAGLAPVRVVQAAVIYGVDFNSDELVTIDSVTAAGAAIGPLGFTAVTGLTFDNTGTLFGSTGIADGSRIVRINITTGAATTVGFAGVSLAGLAFDNSSGTMYGISGEHRLYSVNTTTGAASEIGHTGVGGVGEARNLAYDNLNGVMYSIFADSQLYTINKSTGAATLIGPLGFSSGQILGLTFDSSTGTLFSAFYNGVFNHLYSINTTTAVPTQIGVTTGFTAIQGIAIFDAANASIPEPTSLALLGLTAAGFCGVRLRRRRNHQTAVTPHVD